MRPIDTNKVKEEKTKRQRGAGEHFGVVGRNGAQVNPKEQFLSTEQQIL